MPPEATAAPSDAEGQQRVEPYAWFLLAALALVYVLNFVDRQLLTILAPDLKRDLGISDSDFGFLYGTAFGVFYALFGIPLGKLADRWSRVKLLSLGLALWSVMTALSGLSRNFGQIAAARIGVGIGEASANPCAYSLIADYFPPQRRATALGIYSSGLYLGGGISLFLGSSIATGWNAIYPMGNAPLGLAGWQAAFLAVGLPGVLLAVGVAFLREPPRGRFDGAMPAPVSAKSAWASFANDLMDILPPFTIIGAFRRGPSALATNLAMGAGVAAITAGLISKLGDPVQWIAFGLGCYAVISWALALRQNDRATFGSLLGSRTFTGVTIGYGLIAFIGYASTAFTPLFAIETLGAETAEVGWMLGSIGAVAGTLGVIGGGILADRMASNGREANRILAIIISATGMMACHAAIFTATSLTVFYWLIPAAWLFTSATLGSAAGIIVNIVPPQARGTATAAFLLGTNMIGLALGPYTAGKMSEALDSLGLGMLSLLIVGPAIVGLLLLAYRSQSACDRAKQSGSAASPP